MPITPKILGILPTLLTLCWTSVLTRRPQFPMGRKTATALWPPPFPLNLSCATGVHTIEATSTAVVVDMEKSSATISLSPSSRSRWWLYVQTAACRLPGVRPKPMPRNSGGPDPAEGMRRLATLPQ